MERYFILDKFNTWYDWRLVLTAKGVTPPEPKTNYIELDGMSGSLDLSEALTGEITYKNRTITASFWTDEGTFKDRENLIREIVRNLHGKKIKIIEPDDPTHYFYGRVSVKSTVNILPYAELSLEMVCDPWRYAVDDTDRRVDLTSEIIDVIINNNGSKTVNPIITVTDSANINHNNAEISLVTGSYKISDLKLYPGVNIVKVSGQGSVTFTYKEADL